MNDYLWDPKEAPDPEVAALEEALAPLRAPLPPLPFLPARVKPASSRAPAPLQIPSAGPRPADPRAFPWIRASLLAAAGFLLALGLAPREGRVRPTPAPSGWRVVALEGAPRLAALTLEGEGRWRPGEWLETGPQDVVQVEVAEIGELRLAPSSRLRLATTGPNEHRLLLAEGSLSAKVKAPPRLFLVDTPTGRASDLGCAYTLSVDPGGVTTLEVSAGAVELSGATGAVYVPAGARCVTNAEGAPGTPVQVDTTPDFLAALADLDAAWWSEGGLAEGPLGAVLEFASPGDELSLWHLIPRAVGEARQRLIVTMARLTPLPFGVSTSDVDRLDPDALRLWREETPWGAGPTWGSGEVGTKRGGKFR